MKVSGNAPEHRLEQLEAGACKSCLAGMNRVSRHTLNGRRLLFLAFFRCEEYDVIHKTLGKQVAHHRKYRGLGKSVVDRLKRNVGQSHDANIGAFKATFRGHSA